MSFKKKFKELKKEIKKNGLLSSAKKFIIVPHHTPHEIAAGFALGIANAFIPTFSIGLIIVLYISWKKGWNLFATYIGAAFMNPLTASFLFYLDYNVGRHFVNNGHSFVENITAMNWYSVAEPVYTGAILMSIFFSPIAYFLIYGIASEIEDSRRRREKRLDEVNWEKNNYQTAKAFLQKHKARISESRKK